MSLVGTSHQPSVDADGDVSLTGVPAGVYSLRVLLAGYLPRR